MMKWKRFCGRAWRKGKRKSSGELLRSQYRERGRQPSPNIQRLLPGKLEKLSSCCLVAPFSLTAFEISQLR